MATRLFYFSTLLRSPLLVFCALASLVGSAAANTVNQVGSATGSLLISQRGTADFLFDFRVAPGVNNHVPELGVGYSSSTHKSGPLGTGFGVMGTSSISFCGKDFRHDGERALNRQQGYLHADHYHSARLCMDGRRLLLPDGNNDDAAYWNASGAEYRTEDESWQRITRHGDCFTEKIRGGGCHFVVEEADGSQRTYGEYYRAVSWGVIGTQGGISVDLAWHLEKIEDRYGNAINYHYRINYNVTYLDEVTYAGNSVKFFYDDVTDPQMIETSYDGWTKQTLKLRLTKVESSAQGSVFASYHFSYHQSPNSGRSRLEEILECDGSGNCLEPVSLLWHGSSYSDTESNSQSIYRPPIQNYGLLDGYDTDNCRAVLGDYNGDGITDVLCQPKTSSAKYHAMIYYIMPGEVVISAKETHVEVVRHQLSSTVGHMMNYDSGANLIPGDYNGDGLTDLIRQERGGWDNDSSNTFGIYFAKPNNQGFYNLVYPSDPWSQGSMKSDAGVNIITGDFNGDGKTDILRQEKKGWAGDIKNTFHVLLSLGNGSFQWLMPGSNTSYDLFQDLLRSRNNQPVNILTGDFNGDGLTDFAAQNHKDHGGASGNEFRVYLSTGDGHFEVPDIDDYYPGAAADLGSKLQGQDGRDLYAGDFNGDGKTDVLRLEEDQNNFAIFFSKGNGLFEEVSGQPIVDFIRETHPENYAYFKSIHGRLSIVDINGDGRDDIWARGKRSTAHGTRNGVRVYLSKGNGRRWTERRTGHLGSNYEILLPADFTGDGRMDLLQIEDVDIYHFADRQARVVSNESGEPGADGELIYRPETLLRAVHAGNVLQVIDYEPTAAADFNNNDPVYAGDYIAQSNGQTHSAGGSYLVKSLRTGIYSGAVSELNLASLHTVSLDSERVLEYRYRNGVRDHVGGFLGYKEVMTIDHQDETLQTQRYLTSLAFGGRLEESTLHHYSNNQVGQLLSSQAITWEKLNGTSSSSTPRLIRQSQVVRKAYESADTTQYLEYLELYLYDQYGYLVTEAITTPETVNNGKDRVACTTYHHDETNWRIGQPLTETVSGSLNVVPGGVFDCDTPDLLSKREFVYDTNNNLIEDRAYVDDSNWESTYFTYDSFGNLLLTTNDAGVATQTIYSADGRFPVQEIADPTGANLITSFEYDDRFGIATKATTPAGVDLIVEVDAFGREVRNAINDGSGERTLDTTHFIQEGSASVVESRLYDGSTVMLTTRMVTDALGREIRSEEWGTDNQVTVALIEYDAAGRLLRESAPHYAGTAYGDLDWTTYSYDAKGRTATVVTADGMQVTTSREFGGSGNYCSGDELMIRADTGTVAGTGSVRSKIECQSFTGGVSRRVFLDTSGGAYNAQVTNYDLLGRTLELYNQDALGNLVGSSTAYEYDLAGRVTKQSNSSRNEEGIKLVYLNGQLFSEGNTLIGEKVYEYDSAGRHVKTTLTNGAEYTRTYNSVGQLSQIDTLLANGESFSRSYQYDSFDRKVAETVTIDGQTYTSNYSYQWDSQLATVTYPDGSVVAMDYDAASRLSKVELAADGVSAQFDNYTALGQPQNVTYGNGLNTLYTYDNLGRLIAADTQQNFTPLFERDYGWTAFGEVASIDDRFWDNGQTEQQQSQTFSYDERGFLVNATGPYGAINYGYDAAGNLTSKGGVNFTYDKDQVISSSEGYSFAYDISGNRIETDNGTDKLTCYDYSKLDELIAVSVVGYAPGQGGQADCSQAVIKEQYSYDATGSRVKKVDANGGTTLYISGLYEVSILPDGKKRHTKYIPGLSGKVASVTTEDASGATSGVQYPEADYQQVGTRYYHSDHLGSTSVVTDNGGAVLSRTVYKPYGEQSLASSYQSSSVIGNVQRYTFTGKEQDGTGLYYFEARHYDPYTGSFMQADTMAFGSNGALAADLNRYTYGGNNPVTFTDPSGRLVILGTVITAAMVKSAMTAAAIAGATSAMMAASINFTLQAVSGDRINFKEIGIEAGIGFASGFIGFGGAAAFGRMASNSRHAVWAGTTAKNGATAAKSTATTSTKSVKHVATGAKKAQSGVTTATATTGRISSTGKVIGASKVAKATRAERFKAGVSTAASKTRQGAVKAKRVVAAKASAGASAVAAGASKAAKSIARGASIASHKTYYAADRAANMAGVFVNKVATRPRLTYFGDSFRFSREVVFKATGGAFTVGLVDNGIRVAAGLEDYDAKMFVRRVGIDSLVGLASTPTKGLEIPANKADQRWYHNAYLQKSVGMLRPKTAADLGERAKGEDGGDEAKLAKELL